MLRFSAPAAAVRAAFCLGTIAACLAAPARAQRAKPAHRMKTLKAGSMIFGRLDRPLCEAHFAVGDTISATFGIPAKPGGMINNVYTPPFTAVLRRAGRADKSTTLGFALEVVHARFGKVRRNDLQALLRLDPESSDSVTGMPPTRCYSDAIVVGDVKRTLRY
jgi:hypothetical protein